MSRCQMCTAPGRKRQYQGKDVWLCQRHWKEIRGAAK